MYDKKTPDSHKQNVVIDCLAKNVPPIGFQWWMKAADEEECLDISALWCWTAHTQNEETILNLFPKLCSRRPFSAT